MNSGHNVEVINISSDSSDDEQTPNLDEKKPKPQKKEVLEEVVAMLLKENSNLRIHVQALQSHARKHMQQSNASWLPVASSTLKKESSDDEFEKENRDQK